MKCSECGTELGNWAELFMVSANKKVGLCAECRRKAEEKTIYDKQNSAIRKAIRRQK